MGRGVARQSMGDQWKVAIWGPGYDGIKQGQMPLLVIEKREEPGGHNWAECWFTGN